MPQFITKQHDLPKLVYTLSRYEVLSSAIHAVVNLDIPKIISDDKPLSIQKLHADLLRLKIISNKDIEPLIRLLKFLSCYGIFNIENNFIQHTSLSRTLLQPHVVASFTGLTDENWRRQGDFLNYLSELSPTSPVVSQLSPAKVTLDDTNVSLTITTETEDDLMIEMANLQLLSRAIYTASRLNLIDLIYQTKNTIALLAKATKYDFLAIKRLVDILARFKLLNINKNDTLSYTRAGMALMDGDNIISTKYAAVRSNILWWNAIGYLRYCVETGKSPYIAANNIGLFDYLEKDMAERIRFDRGCTNAEAVQDDAIARLDFQFTDGISIVDMGGGNGGLITKLVRFNSKIKEATLFDQPNTIEHLKDKIATTRITNPSNEHANLLHRCVLQPGNFLLPTKENGIPRQKDLYIIKGVLHAFTDEDVVTILKNIAQVMAEKNVIKIIERYINNDNEPHTNKVEDMYMMALFAAKERSLEEYQRLAKLAGLKLDIHASQSCGEYTILSASRDLQHTLEHTKFGAARNILLASPPSKTVTSSIPAACDLEGIHKSVAATSPNP